MFKLISSFKININQSFKAMSKLACVTTKLPTSNEHFKNLFTPELITLSQLFQKYNYELRIAGGAVRDLLMGKLPQDIDFATTATPDEMKTMFDHEQIRLIKNNGEKHGTVTCRINDKENFEVTTLRIDVETDGRHAKVEFTKNWCQDAERRDLTINSMFLDLDGVVYDYFGGHTDLINRQIRFVGDPVARIREDYLRILRYFRFYGRIADQPDKHDISSLNAMRDNAHGLKGISGERIWVELKKIIIGRHADTSLKLMNDLGINQHLGFLGELNFRCLELIHGKILDLNPQPITLISSLINTKAQLDYLHKRVKMSNAELQIATFILNYRHQFSIAASNQMPIAASNQFPIAASNQLPIATSNQLPITASNASELNQPSSLKSPAHTLHSPQNPHSPDTNDNQLANKTSKNDNCGVKDTEYILARDTDLTDPLFELCRDLILDPTVASLGLAKTKASVEELLKYADARDTLEKVREWQPPRFPVDGTVLIEMGVEKGPEFSRVLKRLRDKWRESRYLASQEELLGFLKRGKTDGKVKGEGV